MSIGKESRQLSLLSHIMFLPTTEIGGGLPNFLTTPVVIDNIKNMFRIVDVYFSDQKEGGALDQYLKELQAEALTDNNSLLMTP